MGERNLNFASVKESDVWAATPCSMVHTNRDVILYPQEKGSRFLQKFIIIYQTSRCQIS